MERNEYIQDKYVSLYNLSGEQEEKVSTFLKEEKIEHEMFNTPEELAAWEYSKLIINDDMYTGGKSEQDLTDMYNVTYSWLANSTGKFVIDTVHGEGAFEERFPNGVCKDVSLYTEK